MSFDKEFYNDMTCLLILPTQAVTINLSSYKL